jgi:nicotinate-nucleotide adenylyltransferase
MDERIVLFGGAFDPVHNGHLIAARAIAEQRGYSRITLVPSSRGPHKAPAAASDADRLEMLRLAVWGDELFDVSDLELRRPAPSYTYDTLTEIRQTHSGPIDLIIGADMLADMPNWYRADDVVQMAQLIVAARPPWQDKFRAMSALLTERFGKRKAKEMLEGMCITPLLDISSSDIRRRLGAGLSIRYMVPDAVGQYISSRTLYSPDVSDSSVGSDSDSPDL